MNWALAYSPPKKIFFMLVSEHATADEAFLAMLTHASANNTSYYNYTIRGRGMDLRKWRQHEPVQFMAEAGPYINDESMWVGVRYGSKSIHGNSKAIAYLTQSRTLHRLMQTIDTDESALRGRQMSVSFIGEPTIMLSCIIKPALRAFRIV